MHIKNKHDPNHELHVPGEKKCEQCDHVAYNDYCLERHVVMEHGTEEDKTKFAW